MPTTAEVYAPIAAPPLVPRPYGLFSVAPPTEGSDRWRVGVGWQSTNCMDAGVWRDLCLGGVTEPKVPTDWSCDVTVAEPFTVYLLGQRTGVDQSVAQSEMTAAYEAAEEKAVEAELWAQMSAAADDLGGQPSLGYTLAVIEGNIASRYNGLGVIHMSPFAATVLYDLLESDGTSLRTKANGTRVVVGAGYGDPLSPTVEIIATGAVYVRRGELSAVTAWDLSLNDIHALAERTYLAGWDCFAIKSTLTEAP